MAVIQSIQADACQMKIVVNGTSDEVKNLATLFNDDWPGQFRAEAYCGFSGNDVTITAPPNEQPRFPSLTTVYDTTLEDPAKEETLSAQTFAGCFKSFLTRAQLNETMPLNPFITLTAGEKDAGRDRRVGTVRMEVKEGTTLPPEMQQAMLLQYVEKAQAALPAFSRLSSFDSVEWGEGGRYAVFEVTPPSRAAHRIPARRRWRVPKRKK